MKRFKEHADQAKTTNFEINPFWSTLEPLN